MAGPAVDGVGTVAALQNVVAPETLDGVVAVAAVDVVRQHVADQDIVVVGPDEVLDADQDVVPRVTLGPGTRTEIDRNAAVGACV